VITWYALPQLPPGETRACEAGDNSLRTDVASDLHRSAAALAFALLPRTSSCKMAYCLSP
jgi:hypothetical protein